MAQKMRSVAISDRVVREGSLVMTFKQKPEESEKRSHSYILGKNVLTRTAAARA